jgi:hypothetical protein
MARQVRGDHPEMAGQGVERCRKTHLANLFAIVGVAAEAPLGLEPGRVGGEAVVTLLLLLQAPVEQELLVALGLDPGAVENGAERYRWHREDIRSVRPRTRMASAARSYWSIFWPSCRRPVRVMV